MTAPVSASATTSLASIPSPDQGVWYIGPVPLRAYALCIIAGIIVAILWGDRRWVARGGRKGTVTDIAVFAVPFGLIGGRLYHVATDWHKYFGPGRDPVDALKVWEGGLGIWGAVALGAVGAWIGCRRQGLSLAAFADAVAPGLVLAQAIGRVGNWFNQELYGGPTDLPWGLELYRRIDPASGLADPVGGVAVDHTPVAVVHPTFLYELVWNVGVALFIVWADRQFKMGHGRVFALYVAAYTAGRGWIEMLRTDDATHIFGVRINVFTSLIVFILAVIYLVVVRGKRENPALLQGSHFVRDDSNRAEAGSATGEWAERNSEGPEPSAPEDSAAETPAGQAADSESGRGDDPGTDRDSRADTDGDTPPESESGTDGEANTDRANTSGRES